MGCRTGPRLLGRRLVPGPVGQDIGASIQKRMSLPPPHTHTHINSLADWLAAPTPLTHLLPTSRPLPPPPHPALPPGSPAQHMKALVSPATSIHGHQFHVCLIEELGVAECHPPGHVLRACSSGSCGGWQQLRNPPLHVLCTAVVCVVVAAPAPAVVAGAAAGVAAAAGSAGSSPCCVSAAQCVSCLRCQVSTAPHSLHHVGRQRNSLAPFDSSTTRVVAVVVLVGHLLRRRPWSCTRAACTTCCMGRHATHLPGRAIKGRPLWDSLAPSARPPPRRTRQQKEQESCLPRRRHLVCRGLRSVRSGTPLPRVP